MEGFSISLPSSPSVWAALTLLLLGELWVEWRVYRWVNRRKWRRRANRRLLPHAVRLSRRMRHGA